VVKRIGFDQRSSSTLGPVSTWMGECGWVNHLGM